MNSSLRYFDYAATTPVDSRIIAAMTRCLGVDGIFANPASSSHAAGMDARALVEKARVQVADLIGAQASEIVWTSGATESNNLALKGAADYNTSINGPSHIVTSAIEHKAVLDTCASLEHRGFSVSYIVPDTNGTISVEAVTAALRPDTGMVSLMLVNNELGTLTDIAAIATAVHAVGALLHVDAAQALGKTKINVEAMGIDLLSMSAHKVYGPKGIGALYIRHGVGTKLIAQMHGGGHEGGLRSGTLATHQIVGMGEACAIAKAEGEAEAARIANLAQRLLDAVLPMAGVVHNAAAAKRIPHTVSLTLAYPGFFPFMLTGDLALSSTSACNSAAGTPSHVLSAIGLERSAASQTIRISLGRYTQVDDIDVAIRCILDVVAQCQTCAA